MKKITVLLAVCLVLAGVFALSACTVSIPDAEVNIVAVNFAGYDFAAELVGRDNERVSLEFLAAGDAHSFNPTFADLVKIQNADLFIYVGGESDAAIEEILAENKDVNAFRLIDCVELLEAEEDEGHEEGEGHEAGYDEHVWTSPKNALLIVDALLEALVAVDPDYAEAYTENAAAYKEELRSLDADFEALFASVSEPTLIFGDRFPFLYFAECYGVSYHAAFPGCSSVSEPSPNTVAALISLIKSEGYSTVFYIESGTHEVAERIAAESGTVTALFHSCHKVSSEEIAAGVSYLSLMRRNYEAVKTALTGNV